MTRKKWQEKQALKRNKIFAVATWVNQKSLSFENINLIDEPSIRISDDEVIYLFRIYFNDGESYVQKKELEYKTKTVKFTPKFWQFWKKEGTTEVPFTHQDYFESTEVKEGAEADYEFLTKHFKQYKNAIANALTNK